MRLTSNPEATTGSVVLLRWETWRVIVKRPCWSCATSPELLLRGARRRLSELLAMLSLKEASSPLLRPSNRGGRGLAARTGAFEATVICSASILGWTVSPAAPLPPLTAGLDEYVASPPEAWLVARPLDFSFLAAIAAVVLRCDVELLHILTGVPPLLARLCWRGRCWQLSPQLLVLEEEDDVALLEEEQLSRLDAVAASSRFGAVSCPSRRGAAGEASPFAIAVLPRAPACDVDRLWTAEEAVEAAQLPARGGAGGCEKKADETLRPRRDCCVSPGAAGVGAVELFCERLASLDIEGSRGTKDGATPVVEVLASSGSGRGCRPRRGERESSSSA